MDLIAHPSAAVFFFKGCNTLKVASRWGPLSATIAVRFSHWNQKIADNQSRPNQPLRNTSVISFGQFLGSPWHNLSLSDWLWWAQKEAAQGRWNGFLPVLCFPQASDLLLFLSLMEGASSHRSRACSIQDQADLYRSSIRQLYTPAGLITPHYLKPLADLWLDPILVTEVHAWLDPKALCTDQSLSSAGLRTPSIDPFFLPQRGKKINEL